MIDKAPAWLRHWALLVWPLVLTGAVHDLLPRVQATTSNAVVAAGATFLLLILTPLTRKYGVGADVPVPEPGVKP